MWLSNAVFLVALTWGRRTKCQSTIPCNCQLVCDSWSSPPSHNALQNQAVSTLLYTSTKKQTFSGGSVMYRNLGDFIFLWNCFLNSGYSQAQKISSIYCFKFHFFKISKQGVCVCVCVCDTVALPFTLKSIWRQKKNYVNSNIFTMQKYTLQKSSKRNQNPSRYYNSITDLKFQHKQRYPSFKNPHIKIDLLFIT
jgi:hypothetical protein